MKKDKEEVVRERREEDRRKPLTEEEFRRVIETGKTLPTDRRNWKIRRQEESKGK